MDGGPVVAARAAPAAVSISVDQAVFTSIRSPAGQGYRLVAASAGVRSDEKAEITRRSPSHGSLCEGGSSAVGLCSYPLGSGRQCVAYSCYAGVEHTARGGQRVYTHLTLLEPADYRRLDFDPLPVHAALARAVGGSPLLKPPPRLDRLSLTVSPAGGGSPDWPGALTSEEAEQIRLVTSVLLARRRLVWAGARCPFRLLEWALVAVPPSARGALAVSVGLKFAAARRMDLSVVDRDGGAIQRAIAGGDVQLFDVQHQLPQGPSPFGAWLDRVYRSCRAGRFEEMRQVTALLCAETEPRALGRIAQIWNDMDRVRTANKAELEQLAAQYVSRVAETEAEARLIEQLTVAARERGAALEPQHPAAVAGGGLCRRGSGGLVVRR